MNEINKQHDTYSSQSVDSTSIDQRLMEIASRITTVEEWKKFIDTYYPAFCTVLSKLETRLNNTPGPQSYSNPIAVITGGQPGAGKSALIAKYKEILQRTRNINAVVNNADFYRFCVPGSYRIAIDFPERASEITDPVVKMMRKSLIEESIAQRQSIIIENTLGDSIAVDTIRDGNAHDIWLALMAVPREESLLSDFERYIRAKEACEVARLVSIDAHDKRYFALDKIAAQLENSGIRTLVHSRGKTESDFPVLEYDSHNNGDRRYRCATEVMDTIRARSISHNSDSYIPRLRIIREKMKGFGMNENEEEELSKLEKTLTLSLKKTRGPGGR